MSHVPLSHASSPPPSLTPDSFIQSNHSVIMYNNTMISFNMLEASRVVGTVKRFFYASSACIYPEFRQLDVTVESGGLKEADAWPAQPQDAYGLEKLASEELAMVRVWEGERGIKRTQKHTPFFFNPPFPSHPTALRQRLWH